jgi:hypothetical protein
VVDAKADLEAAVGAATLLLGAAHHVGERVLVAAPVEGAWCPVALGVLVGRGRCGEQEKREGESA